MRLNVVLRQVFVLVLFMKLVALVTKWSLKKINKKKIVTMYISNIPVSQWTVSSIRVRS